MWLYTVFVSLISLVSAVVRIVVVTRVNNSQLLLFVKTVQNVRCLLLGRVPKQQSDIICDIFIYHMYTWMEDYIKKLIL